MNNLTIAQQWEAVTKIKVFEIEVIEKRNGEKDYILFNISIHNGKFRAEHIALNEKEQLSKFVAFEEVDIDEDFSLDENLENLYDACYNAICESEFYDQFYLD